MTDTETRRGARGPLTLLSAAAAALALTACSLERYEDGTSTETGGALAPDQGDEPGGLAPAEDALETVTLAGGALDADGAAQDARDVALEAVPADEGPGRLELDEAAWRDRLTPEEFRVLRKHGTERAGSGDLLNEKRPGAFTCAACGLELFRTETKFESGTGWPSFYQPAIAANVANEVDRKFGMVRTEVHCARCDGHLGHVFPDGPKPTGLRYCINSVSLDFEPAQN